MRAPAKLGLYGTALVAVFAVAFVAADAVVPHETVQSWADDTDDRADDHAGGQSTGPSDTAEQARHRTGAAGLTVASEGHRLSAVSAPTKVDAEGELTLTVRDPEGQPVRDFELSHEKELHLIVVRADGTGFRHEHPKRDADGQWSIPWRWDAAGSHRVYAEFVPARTGEDVTLSTVVQVAGDFRPSPPSGPVTTTETNGYRVSIGGDLTPGEASTLTATVVRDGEQVTTLEPYLGAYGHLVALREGDLAYLHVHPRGTEPSPGETSGPEVDFDVTAPTPGRYLLYLNFQVNGQVHTAQFVLDADASGSPSPAQDDGEHVETGHEEEGEHDHGE